MYTVFQVNNFLLKAVVGLENIHASTVEEVVQMKDSLAASGRYLEAKHLWDSWVKGTNMFTLPSAIKSHLDFAVVPQGSHVVWQEKFRKDEAGVVGFYEESLDALEIATRLNAGVWSV